jgi:two-component system, OmpR family, sensor histidine kinase MtrB
VRQPRHGGTGLRLRITIAFVGAALAVSALVAGTTFALAQRYLIEQRVDDALEQGFSNVRFAGELLSAGAEGTDAEPAADEAEAEVEETLSDLVNDLEQRGLTAAMVVSEGTPFPSSFAISLESVPARLVDNVERGHVGYALDWSGSPRLIFGSPLPAQDLEAYFFFPLTDLAQTLQILSRVLIGVSLGAVLLAVLVGTRVSNRVVDPVRRASRAARRVAEGLLETRLEVHGDDELATLASSFNEMAAALEERIGRDRRFVGDVSHELRTPLTTLRTSAEYLMERVEGIPVSSRRAVELLAADIEYLQRLVDDLLDLSRVEAGRVDMAWERLNVADLAREVVARRTRTGDGDVRIEVEAAPDELSTVADKQRLERVVGNLLDNALTHGQGKDVTVWIGAEDGLLRLAVEDHGPGIPREAGARIFERFYKADPARPRGERRGSGLGLAIARENAHLHGGEIAVYNGRSGGARFELRLPRRSEEPEG